MKFNLTICFLAFTTFVFAQKRELQKIEKALMANNVVEAKKIFSEIDENSVDPALLSTYKLANGFVLLGDIQNSKASLEDAELAGVLFAEAKALGYDRPELIALGEQLFKDRLYRLGEEYIVKKDYEKAALVLEKIYLTDKSSLTYANDAANLYYSAGNLEKAYELYKMLFEKEFNGVKTIYKAVRTTNGAIIEYENPSVRDRDINLGIASTPTQSKTESVAGDLVLKLVYLTNKLKSLTEAKDVFQEAQKIYVGDQSLELTKPDIYLQLGMHEEYLKATETLLADIKDPKTFDNLAEIAQQKSDWDQTIKYYSSSLALNANNFVANVNIANAYIQKGNGSTITGKEQEELYKSALSHLEKANEIQPKDPNVVNTLTQIYGLYKMDAKLAELKAKQ